MREYDFFYYLDSVIIFDANSYKQKSKISIPPLAILVTKAFICIQIRLITLQRREFDIFSSEEELWECCKIFWNML